jgi:hypothetical protein
MRFKYYVAPITLLVMFICLIKYKNRDTVTHHTHKVSTVNDYDRKISFVRDNFKVYDKTINDDRVTKFVDVLDMFELSESDRLVAIYVAQICQESGAKHDINGKVNMVSRGLNVGIGFAQITPRTAFHYLKNKAKKGELVKLGCSNYNFVKNVDSVGLVHSELENWLSNYNNNVILWGYITKRILDSNNGNTKLSLIEYNKGRLGMRRYIKTGKSANSHEYVVAINKIVNNGG